MNNYNKGYDPKEVNEFLDKVIINVNKMIKSSREKDQFITDLSNENLQLREALKQKDKEKDDLNNTINIYTEKVKYATSERELLLKDARRNADRIVNDALIRAERTEGEAMMLRRNIRIFKRRLRDIIEHQLEVIEDIEQVEL